VEWPLWGRGFAAEQPDGTRPLTRNHLEEDSTCRRLKQAALAREIHIGLTRILPTDLPI